MKIVIILARQQLFMALVFVFLHIVPLHIPLKTIVQNFVVEMISMLKELVQRTFVNAFNKSFGI
jgi:hypothetical protein